MVRFEIQDGDEFSLLRASGFARDHGHAFVIRGRSGGALFRPGPVPRESIVEAAGLGGASLHLARQVHGAAVWEVGGDPSGFAGSAGPALPGGQRRAGEGSEAGTDGSSAPPEADALIASSPAHAVAVATADCLPILLAIPNGPGAAVHAGWRGLLAGVIEATVQRLGEIEARPRMTTPDSKGRSTRSGKASFDGRQESRGASRPWEAVIGPAIGPCCFEVGPEVADRFRARFLDHEALIHTMRSNKSRIDLPGAARSVLQELGIERTAVHTVTWCTRCGVSDAGSTGACANAPISPVRPLERAVLGEDDDISDHLPAPSSSPRLESYRRDGAAAGRLISFISPLRKA